MIAFVHDPQFGRIGHYVFLYNSEEFVARLNRLPQTVPRVPSSVQSILPDRMSTGHLTRGTMSIIPPDLHHGDEGIFVTPHTAGAQSTANTSTAQRSSIDIGGGLLATTSGSPYSRLRYHDSVASHTAGAQSTASTPALQQLRTDTGGGFSATSTSNPVTAAHPYIRGSVPPPASAPDTSSTRSPGAYPASGLDASGRLFSSDWTFNNRHPAMRPIPQPADAHPKDRPNTSSANRTTALEPNQTARKTPSQAQASNDSAGAGAPSASAVPEAQESWGTDLRTTILAEARTASYRSYIPAMSTPAIGGAFPFNPQAQSRTAFAAARVGNFPSYPTSQTQDMTGAIRPGGSSRRSGSRPRPSTGAGQDRLQVSQSHNAAAYGGYKTSGIRPPLQAQTTSGSDGTGSSARPATSQAHSMAASAGFPLLPPFQQHPATPVTAGRVPSPPAASQAVMRDHYRQRLLGLPTSSHPQLAPQPAQNGSQASQSNNNAAANMGRRNAEPEESMKAQSTTDSDGVDISARPATPHARFTAASTGGGGVSTLSTPLQAQSTNASAGPGSSPHNAIVIDNEVTSTPATGGGNAPTIPGNLQATPLTASAAPDSPSVSVNLQVESTPGTGGGDVPSSLFVSPTESVAGSGSDGASSLIANSQAQSTAAPAEAGVPSLPVDQQATSAAATDNGGVSSPSGVPQAASTTGAGSDNNGGTSGNKRKRSEQESEGSQRRTKK